MGLSSRKFRRYKIVRKTGTASASRRWTKRLTPWRAGRASRVGNGYACGRHGADGQTVRAVRRRPPVTYNKESAMSKSVKQQVIEDMQMAGLAPSTRKNYLAHIVRFVNRTRIRPQDATEAQVAEYLRGLINQGKCQGTIQPIR